jgi:predicted alpha/beta hydrolase family esterase
MDVLILPGLGGSGPAHWQTLWEQQHGYARVEQRDWDAPELGAWLDALDHAIVERGRPCVLVAHSLACALVAHYGAKRASAARTRICGALLVAPADVEDPERTPDCTRGFAPMPLVQLPFRAHVVASDDDPYVSPARARQFAGAWGATFESIGDRGHINAESALGDWPLGHTRLLSLLA